MEGIVSYNFNLDTSYEVDPTALVSFEAFNKYQKKILGKEEGDKTMNKSEKYTELQQLIADMIKWAGSGHYASSMTALEIMYPLFYEQKIEPDQFILSKGHAAPALYAILYDLGYLKGEVLDKFRQYDGLPGHPELSIPGVLVSSGSLGMGVSKAMGLAFANPKKEYHVLVGDGELQEGQNWEAQMNPCTIYNNIKIHVDCNGHQFSRSFTVAGLSKHQGGNVTFHETSWLKSNSYLTQPKKPDTTYSDALVDAMSKDNRIIALNADLEQDFGLTRIKQYFPDRYIQCGIFIGGQSIRCIIMPATS